ncbi:MAG: 50S ribosomal protein L28 [Firmicutes bacterium]|jgi:large subunit ribosomal protein L28|nr:50S ribosomal protein L28 [Bacillota bacterium]
MGKVCEICGKKQSSGFTISHSHVKTKRAWKPNIQRIRVSLKKDCNRKMNVCTTCIKSGRVTRAIRKTVSQ